MIQLNWTDPAVQAAVVGAVGNIFSAAIAAICAGVIGAQISGRKQLLARLRDAVDDVHFLLAVERAHSDLHQELNDESYKMRARQIARDQGYTWSGKYTPGRTQRIDELR